MIFQQRSILSRMIQQLYYIYIIDLFDLNRRVSILHQSNFLQLSRKLLKNYSKSEPRTEIGIAIYY